MLATVKKLKNKVISKVHEFKKSKFRSPKWDNVRDDYIKKFPNCAACGNDKSVQVHHIKPFHLFPELELEEANLISLCMGNDDCHLKIGHGDSFKYYNPDVGIDSASYRLSTTEERVLLIKEAKKKRLS